VIFQPSGLCELMPLKAVIEPVQLHFFTMSFSEAVIDHLPNQGVYHPANALLELPLGEASRSDSDLIRLISSELAYRS
jgi:hypothetical protein